MSSSSASADSVSKPKKKSRVGHVQAACINCRSRRRKCDGVRPACSSCVNRQVPCTYDTQHNETRRAALRRQHESSERSLVQLQRLLDTLLYAPEHEATALLAQMRSQVKVDVSNAVAPILQMRIENGAFHASQDPSADQVLLGLDHKLANHFPQAYPILVGDLTPELYVPYSMPQASPPVTSPGHYVDLRLQRLDISFWTTTISSTLAAELINLYLEVEHPLSGHFDADLFLNDLVSHRTEHCSLFLVSAVLCWSCRMRAALDPATAAVEPMIREELDSIWDVERYNDSALTLAAISIYTSLSATTGRDMQTRVLRWEGASMAERLNFFNHVPVQRPQQKEYEPLYRSQSHVAWSTYYTWLVLGCVYVGDVFPGPPPALPIPAATPSNHLGSTFTVLCKLTSILHDIVTVYNTGYGPIVERVPLDFVQARYGELLAWSSELNRHQVRSPIAPHNVDHLHLQYHTILMLLFRPFKHVNVPFDQVQATPAELESASLHQIKSLMIRYRRHYSNTLYCVHWMPFLVQTFVAVLRDPSDEVWKFYSQLIIDCFADLAVWHQTMNLTILCLMGTAVTRGRVSQAAMSDLIQGFQRRQSYVCKPPPPVLLASEASDPDLKDPGSLLANYVQNLSLSHFEDVPG